MVASYANIERSEDVDAVNDLILLESELLDNGDFEKWLDLYCADCTYWVPLKHNQADIDSDFSLMLESRPLLEMRIERMRHPSAHGMEMPIRTSRVLSGLKVTLSAESSAKAFARFLIVEAENDRQRIFAGRYEFDLIKEKESWKIMRKRVDLVNSESPFASIQIIL